MRVERTQHICVPFRLSTHAEPETYRWFTAERRAYDRKVEMAITSKTANKTERKAQGLAKGPVAAAQPNLMLTDDDIHLFGTGMWQRAWEKMGAHKDVQGNSEGWLFRVWAPQVSSVHVVGDFNGWDPKATPLTRAANSDIWETFVPGLEQGSLYKYVIETDAGELLWKADPFGFYAETCPGTASKLWDLGGYTWKDATWLNRRAERDIMKSPLNIYEVHLGSWKRHGNEPQGEAWPRATGAGRPMRT